MNPQQEEREAIPAGRDGASPLSLHIGLSLNDDLIRMIYCP